MIKVCRIRINWKVQGRKTIGHVLHFLQSNSFKIRYIAEQFRVTKIVCVFHFKVKRMIFTLLSNFLVLLRSSIRIIENESNS